MPNLNTSTLATSIKVQYERRLLTRALPRLVHGRWSVQARIGNFGSLEWRKYGALSSITSTLTEGTTPDEQAAPSISTVTAQPSFYGAWLSYTDLLEMEAFDPYVSEVSGILGEQAGVSADSLIRNAMVDGATVDYSAGQSARTSLVYPEHEISYADFVDQIAQLEASSARYGDGMVYPVIIHPHTYASLMNDPVFVNMFTKEAPNTALRTGLVGRIMQCEVYISSNAKEWTDGGASSNDVYSALFIGNESYGTVGIAGLEPNPVDSQGADMSARPLTGKQLKPVDLIMKGIGSAGTSDPLDQRGTIGWKMAFDVEILDATWLRSLEHVNRFSAS
jgi:N4-gp56 family major capsid protein